METNKKRLWGCHNCSYNLRLWNDKFNLSWVLGEMGGVKRYARHVNDTTEVQRIYTSIIKASPQNSSIQSMLICIKFWLIFKKTPADLRVNRFFFCFCVILETSYTLVGFYFRHFQSTGMLPRTKRIQGRLTYISRKFLMRVSLGERGWFIHKYQNLHKKI